MTAIMGVYERSMGLPELFANIGNTAALLVSDPKMFLQRYSVDEPLWNAGYKGGAVVIGK